MLNKIILFSKEDWNKFIIIMKRIYILIKPTVHLVFFFLKQTKLHRYNSKYKMFATHNSTYKNIKITEFKSQPFLICVYEFQFCLHKKKISNKLSLLWHNLRIFKFFFFFFLRKRNFLNFFFKVLYSFRVRFNHRQKHTKNDMFKEFKFLNK